MLQHTDPYDPRSHIRGVRVRRLKVNKDPRGILVETLRADWPDFYDERELPFAQSYYSVTEAGVARDEDRWHLHRAQEDRFVVLSGVLAVAMHDPRPDSPTRGLVNVFRMGDLQDEEGRYALMVPRRVHHGFVVGPADPAMLMNFPTQIYSPADEGRIPLSEVGARLPDGSPFSWDAVRVLLELTK